MLTETENIPFMRMIKISLCFFLLFLSGCNSGYHANGSENYNKNDIVNNYHADLDSNLSVFPDIDFSKDCIVRYEADLHTGLFDTDGKIILQSEYTTSQFEKEINRLENISMTIRDKEKEYTNKVLYDTEMYNFPAFIANDGFGNTYEYALIDQEKKSITYIYLAYPDINQFAEKEWLKRDLSAYDEANTFNAYSIYNHSFDNGKTWTEFDD
ncbi:MAG: hypothetical protein IKR11_07895 [Solobacterium sp.]|nr:hypothetical protein [Solobacterium sp.]